MLLAVVENREKRRTMGIVELRAWERIIWGTLRTHAERREQHDSSDRLAKLTPPAALHWTSALPLNSVRKPEEGSASEVANLLHEGCKLMEQSQSVLALPRLLRALHASSLYGYELLRLRAVCLVAECRTRVSPTVGEARRGLRELEEVWGEVLRVGTEEGELIGLACEVRGRALVIVAEEGTGHDLVDAVANLERAYKGTACTVTAQ